MQSTALVYLRQSRTNPHEQTVSLDVQEAACRKLAAVAACQVVEVFKDADTSGGKLARAGYDALLARLATGGIAVVAAYDQGRLFRRLEFAVSFKALLEKLEKQKHGAAVEFVHGSYAQSTIGKFSAAILAAAHELEREMAGDKTRDAYRFMNSKGVPTGPAPYGLRYVGGTRKSHELELDPEAAPIARRIFTDYATGKFTTRSLAETLNDEGITNARGGRWKPDSLAHMLGNVAYNGRTYSESRFLHAGETIDALWPKLIEDGQFARCQERLKAFRIPTVKGSAKRKREFTFRGLLWCQDCGRRLVVKHHYHGTYYYCGSRRDGNPCEQGEHAIREDALTPWVDSLMNGIEAAWDASAGHSWLRVKAADKATAAGAVETIERQIKNLGTRFQVEEVSADEYRAELERLRLQRAVWAAQVIDEPTPAEFKGMPEHWRAGDTAARWEVLTALFERLIVNGRKIVGYRPRADRAGQVVFIVNTALNVPDPDAVTVTDFDLTAIRADETDKRAFMAVTVEALLSIPNGPG